MAQRASTSLPGHAADSSTADLDRFRRFLRHGRPGPHAYVVLLGLDTFDAPDLFRSVKKGFAYRTFVRLRQNTSLPFERLLDVIGMPRRTLTRRKNEGRFLPDESDRLLRASRVFGHALELFEGDRDAAIEWLTSGQPALGGAVPLDLARSEVGAVEVERLVGRLENGIFS
jgi:putative toxin-antitoxin system antitoxin component (TIGR02293 family)